MYFTFGSISQVWYETEILKNCGPYQTASNKSDDVCNRQMLLAIKNVCYQCRKDWNVKNVQGVDN